MAVRTAVWTRGKGREDGDSCHAAAGQEVATAAGEEWRADLGEVVEAEYLC